MSVTFVVVSVVLLCFRPIFPFSAFVLSFHFLLFNHFFSSGDSIQVHCVDLGESWPTSIYLQNLASIQPRRSFVKFARSPRTVLQIAKVFVQQRVVPRAA